MFTIEMLPAQRGDALWITYGRPGALHHLLIDGGPQESMAEVVPALEARIAAIPGKADRVELLVVTHVDADHIQGIVSLLSDPARVPLFRDVWFNGWKHLQPEVLGGLDAERMTAPLLQHEDRWNAAFQGHAVVVPDDGPLPVIELADGMRLTLLSPTHAALTALVPEWEAACKAAGVLPGEGAPIVRKGWIRDEVLGGFDPDLLAQSRFSADPSKPNGSGIAFVAEYDGKRALFLADCPPGPVLRALDRLGPRPHRFDVVKVGHHGSRRNTDSAFAQAVQARTWLISTDGAVFGHPDPESLARIIVGQAKPPVLAFNYVTDHIGEVIADAGERYRVLLPKKAEGAYLTGLVVKV
ncbi:MAG: hypothetical protein J0I70_08410 [Microbacterium sp.]|uniref:ComEC/Rec2 family competence protein n=1 Tax=Microbacterium sp. TaxID=51671 RepID=UPI001AC88C0C|nr:hypothetical protein [Microbacterium sp.]MBN9174161.1 hypothetical protein [Microbacterium sp.]